MNLGEEEDTAPYNETNDEENGNDPSSQSIENIVEEYTHVDEDNHSSVAAFNLIQAYISNDKAEEDKANAEEMATTALSKPALTAIVTLLLKYLPRSQQKKVTTEKAMQKEIAK